MRNPVDIVAELVSRIDTSLNGKNGSVNTDGTYTFQTCDAKYATDMMFVDGIRIKSVVSVGNYFEITLESEPSVINYQLNSPVYHHGSAIDINTERQELAKDWDRPTIVPMIYFPSTRKQTERPEFSPVEMLADCRLVFATSFDQRWIAEQLKDNCINPMYALFELFRDVCMNDPLIRVESWSEEQFYRLGDKVEGKGTVYNSINEYCSGIVVDFTLEVYHGFKCSCCCEI